MKTNFYSKADSLKETIQKANEKSRDIIKSVVEANTKGITKALEINKKSVDALKEKFYSKNVDQTIIDAVNKTFGKGVRLSEDIIDSIIDAHSNRMQTTIDGYLKLVDKIKEQEFKSEDNALELLSVIQKNFDDSVELSTKNMQTIVDAYNKHLNLALNFNEKFADNINSHIELVNKIQNNTVLNPFNNWVAEWRKQTVREREVEFA